MSKFSRNKINMPVETITRQVELLSSLLFDQKML